MAASIGVYGTNKEAQPPAPALPEVTLLAVVGEGFPPGAAVSLKVETPSLGREVTAKDDGTFYWEEKVRPQLGDEDTLSVVATYADPTDPDASPLTVQGNGTVEVDVIVDGHDT